MKKMNELQGGQKARIVSIEGERRCVFFLDR